MKDSYPGSTKIAKNTILDLLMKDRYPGSTKIAKFTILDLLMTSNDHKLHLMTPNDLKTKPW